MRLLQLRFDAHSTPIPRDSTPFDDVQQNIDMFIFFQQSLNGQPIVERS